MVGAVVALRQAPIAQLFPTLLTAAFLWTISSWGYYAVVEVLGLERGYDQAPFTFVTYYLAWSLIAMFAFRRALARELTTVSIANHAIALFPILILIGLFSTLVLPLFPDISVFRAPPNPPEFMFSSAWYYLPKSTDILFQQVMIAAIVRTADHLKIRIVYIAFLLATMFGGIHLTLALDGFTSLYVARFTAAAVIFGFCAPFLYLRVKHGFRWAYTAHFTFYLLDSVLTHLLLAVPASS